MTPGERETRRAEGPRLRAAGHSKSQIAEALGLKSGGGALGRWLRGVPAPAWTRRPRAKDGLREQAVAMRREGRSYREIREELGVSKSTLSLWLRDVMLTEEQRHALADRRATRVEKPAATLHARRLVRESSIIDDYSHRLLGKEHLDGHDSYKIELIPKPDSPIVWSRVIAWIAVDKYFQLKIEHYDERNELVNTLTFSDVRKFGDREIPSKLVMEPKDKKGHQTILVQDKIDFNPGLKEDFFSIQNLQRIR